MSASSSGTTVQFTPLQGPAATTANATVLKVAQAEPQLSRTYYQDGRLLTAVDLNRDYAYLDRRLLDLGLALGDGVIQGLVASVTGGHHDQRHRGPRRRAERPRHRLQRNADPGHPADRST